VSCEGRAQSFHGVVKPLGDTRPAWKVLRVLGNLLGLEKFDYETAESIRDEVLGQADIVSSLSNLSTVAPTLSTAGTGLERLTDVSIYSTDGIVRRAESLQKTADAQATLAWIGTTLAQKLGVSNGDMVMFTKGGSILLNVGVDQSLPENVVRVAAGHETTSNLDGMFGAITVERA